MKKNRINTTRILTVLTAAMILTGCTGKENGSTMENICVFRQTSQGIPVKTVLSSAKTTSVCVDPLCTHETECPLNGAANMGDLGGIALGNRYCFVKGSIGIDVDTGEYNGECQLCVYDMTEGTIQKIEAYADNILLMDAHGRYVYYAVASYNNEKDVISYGYSLYRADVESHDIIEIPLTADYSTENAMSTGDYPSIYAFDDNSILWMAPDHDGYAFYTTDLAGEKRKDLEMPNNYVMNGQYHDGWAYYTRTNHDVSIVREQGELGRIRFQHERSLYRYHFATGKDELLSENISRYIVTDDGIFYTVLEENPTVFSWNGISYYDMFAGKIYRMNSDGTKAGLFCTLDGVDLSVYTSLFLGYTNGYLALEYMDYVENKWYDSGYDYNISSELIIINTKDSSWRISTDET